MLMERRNQWIGIPIVFLLLIGTPLLIGVGCPNNFIEGIPIRPITSGSGTQVGADGNPLPQFSFVEPAKDKSVSVGTIVEISWTDEDYGGNARITLVLDPDNTLDNGNEITILTDRRMDIDDTYDSFSYDTRFLGQAAYRLIARIVDGVNPEQVFIAPGRIVTLSDYIASTDPSPTIVAESPVENITVGHDDLFTISWRGWDRPGADSDLEDPIVIVLLDFDRDPSNDVDFSDPDMLGRIEAICENPQVVVVEEEETPTTEEEEENIDTTPETFPRINPRNPTLSGNLEGAYAMYCVRNTDQERPTGASGITIQEDVTLIPPLPDGSPYNVRIMMWDRVNPPVHSYAWGTISISKMAGSLVDLAQVGKSISGTRFLGFHAEAWLGSAGVALGDFDSDGADDFALVARYGQPFERGKIGAAWLVYGQPPTGDSPVGRKFGGQVSINNFDGSTNPDMQYQGYRGTLLAMGQAFSDTSRLGVNSDGMASIHKIADVTGDGTPEIIFGLPRIVGLRDYLDDDPCDADPPFYYDDLWPNRLSEGSADNIGYWDSTTYPYPYITSGYVIITYGDSILNNSIVEVALTGQFDPDYGICIDEGWCRPSEEAPNGVRYRGYWYDNLDVPPGRFGRVGQFGKTAKAIPDMTGDNSFYDGRDGYEELLISTPDYVHYIEEGTLGRGTVLFILGKEFTSRLADPVKSFPRYEPVGDPCVARAVITVDQGKEVNIYGEQPGDEFGYAGAAGDFNLDGHTDILAGAPGADRKGMVDNGIVYIIFGRLDMGHIYLGDIESVYSSIGSFYGDRKADNPPRVEIYGNKSGARLGERQTALGDVNGDGIPDIAISSPVMDSPTAANAGFVGVVFGGQRMTGENAFMADEIGTSALKGVRLYGSLNSGAGEYVADAGDFNGDGLNDLLIVAANESHIFVNEDGTQISRRGVCYLVFGGAHLNTQEFNLSQVGTSELPGVKFISPYKVGSVDEAAILWAGSAGDVNADGFDDVLLGLPLADYVYPQDNPVKRRKDAGEVYLIYGNNNAALLQ